MLKRELSVAQSAAEEAGELLRKHFATLRKGQIHEKAAHEYVTDLDRAANRLIVARLRRAFPNHGIVSEEGLSRPSRSGHAWVIDPLDGTKNYVLRVPVYAVSLALTVNGMPILGVTRLPDTQESFTAVVGQGARRNGGRIRVSQTRSLRPSICSLSDGQTRAAINRALHIERRLDFSIRSLRHTGSTAYNLIAVACGRTDAALFAGPIHPWDVLAGTVIVREAGGEISTLEGRVFTPQSDTLLASNRQLHPLLIARLR